MLYCYIIHFRAKTAKEVHPCSEHISLKRGSVRRNTVSVRECRQGTDARSLPAAGIKAGPSFRHSLKFTTSLRKNHEFKRLYNKGKSAASQYAVVYIRRNGSPENRLGITVSTKLGGAVQRNRIRRRLKEVYRLNEGKLYPGYDIVIVARMRGKLAEFSVLESSVLGLFRKLGVTAHLREVKSNDKGADRPGALLP